MKTIRKILLAASILLIFAIQYSKAQTFTEQTGINITGVSNSSVTWGDYDNDGDLDILLTGYNGSNLISKIYKNNNDNTFTELTGINLAVGNSVADWGDYDNDGDLDILLIGYDGTTNHTIVYRNDGADTFTNITGNLCAESYNRGIWGDFDNDGDLDILVSFDNSVIKTYIYRNDGNDTFTEVDLALTINVDNGSFDCADYDNDGDLDFLITGYYSSGTYYSLVYRNDGNLSFTDINANLIGMDACKAKFGDYDNDGDQDIILTGRWNAVIYKNNGNDTFTEQTEITLIDMLYEGDNDWGDYDNDGDLDILLAGMYLDNGDKVATKIYKNNGDNTFTEQTDIILTGIRDGSIAWGDYDNDGDLDIILTGNSDAYGSNNVTKILLYMMIF